MNEAAAELRRACVELGHAIWTDRRSLGLFVVVVWIVVLALHLAGIA